MIYKLNIFIEDQERMEYFSIGEFVLSAFFDYAGTSWYTSTQFPCIVSFTASNAHLPTFFDAKHFGASKQAGTGENPQTGWDGKTEQKDTFGVFDGKPEKKYGILSFQILRIAIRIYQEKSRACFRAQKR